VLCKEAFEQGAHSGLEFGKAVWLGSWAIDELVAAPAEEVLGVGRCVELAHRPFTARGQ